MPAFANPVKHSIATAEMTISLDCARPALAPTVVPVVLAALLFVIGVAATSNGEPVIEPNSSSDILAYRELAAGPGRLNVQVTEPPADT